MENSLLDNSVANNLQNDQVDLLVEKLLEVQMYLQSLTEGTNGNPELQDATQAIFKLAQTLRKSEARYKRLIKRMWAIVFEVEPDGNMLDVNEVVTKVTGYLPEELLGKAWIERLFPEEFKLQVDYLLERCKSGDVTSYEISLMNKDQNIITLELNSANEYSQQGDLEKIVGLCLDVTERKQAEDRLRKSQKELVQAQRIAHLGSWIWDIPSNTVTWSEELHRIYGVAPDEGGHSYEDYLSRIHPEDRGRVDRIIKTAYHDLKPFHFEERILRPDGEIRFLDSRGEVISGKSGVPVRMIGICHDITEQKRAYQILREREEIYRLLVENVKEYAIFSLDQSGQITSWNVGAKKIKGYSFDEIIGQHFSIFYPEDARNMGVPDTALERAKENGRFEAEGWRLRKDGSRFWASVVITALYDDSEELRGFSKIVRDMTQRREAEEKLRQSEARFRSIFYGVEAGIELVDLDGDLIEFNPSVCEMFGYTRDELLAATSEQLNHPANFVVNLPIFDQIRRGERDYHHAERPFMHKEGHLIWGRLTISLVRDAEQRPQFVIGMIENITHQKQMEYELAELNRRLMEGREAERLHLAQELHDGPVQDLYSLSYNLAAIKSELSPEVDKNLIDRMESGVQQVVKTLKGVSSDLRPPALAPYGLEKAIRSYIEEFQQTNSHFIVHMDLEPDGQQLPEPVRLVLYRIFQSSFTNVVRHAQANEVNLRFDFDEVEATLQIEDDGVGFRLPDRWIELAREGHLGIVGAVERAEAVGGTFDIDSTPGLGTKICVRIPLKDDDSGFSNSPV